MRLRAPGLRAPSLTPSRATDSSGDVVRLRLDLSYDGSEFHGWAGQPGVRTVQGVLEEALRIVLRLAGPAALTVAGRTDAGVHARGQVAHLDVPAQAWDAAAPHALHRLGRLLPGDVRVHAVQVAADGFDARFSALWRRYSYRICDDPVRADPVHRRFTLWHPASLDPDLMNEAAAACLGEHDFAAFCRRRPGASTIRNLIRLDWHRHESGALIGTVIADAFCHNMVRALTGASLAVGDGRRPSGWLAELLAAQVRNPGVTVAPPHPLCLEEVGYPPAAELLARAQLTRRFRGAPEPVD